MADLKKKCENDMESVGEKLFDKRGLHSVQDDFRKSETVKPLQDYTLDVGDIVRDIDADCFQQKVVRTVKSKRPGMRANDHVSPPMFRLALMSSNYPQKGPYLCPTSSSPPHKMRMQLLTR